MLRGNGYTQQHFSALEKINTQNAQNLGLAWYADLPILDGLTGNPLVADGLVYQSGPLGVVFAHDLPTGKLRWRYNAELEWGENILTWWALRNHRGLAMWEDKVIFATGDCRLHALNRFTGELVWRTQSCDPAKDYTITAAPTVGNGMVFTGNACQDYGTNRGFVDALDVDTGERRWRFYTVPGEPPEGGYSDPIMEMASMTWGSGEWWKKSFGCGSVWEGINYDDKTNLVFIGTGGPSPFNPTLRAEDAGDELFTNSIVALDADKGQYVWHYTVTPGDAWNYEAANQMITADLSINGVERRVLMAAPKNGFFYVLDAETGEFISANNYVPVNWASKIDPDTGRPVFLDTDEAKWWLNEDGAEVYPSPMGARSWQSISYSPKTGLVYIPAISLSARLKVEPLMGVGGVSIDFYIARKGEAKYEAYGALIAWDPITQTERWSVRRQLPLNGGVISTAGELVFQATGDGKFEAYNAANGTKVWSMDIGATANAAPTTVEVDGEQIVLLPAGNGGSGGLATMPELGTLASTRAPSRLLAFKLNGDVELPPTQVVEISKPQLPKQPEDLAEHGGILSEIYLCDSCHGRRGVSINGAVTDLRNSKMVPYLDALRVVVKDGALTAKGMPKFPEITDDELIAIQAYITNGAWHYYESQQALSSKEK